MPNHASITLIGHLGRDPEVKTVGDSQVASVSMAVTKKYKDKETTSWFDLSVWGKRADVFAQYVHKGDPVMVQGEPSIEEYDGKDGMKKMKVKVRVSDFTLLGGKRDGQSAEPRQETAKQSAPTRKYQASAEDAANEIPF